MAQFDPTMDDAFREYADLQLRRHYLLSDGMADSAETAAAEERMEELWGGFDEIQRQSLSGMASDLNWIRRKCEPPPMGRIIASSAEKQELEAAMKADDWHRVLHHLRLCAASYHASSVARERGIAFAAIGLPNYASLFKAKAIEIAAAEPAITAANLLAQQHLVSLG